MVGSTVGSTWLCWAINLSKAFDSSDKRLNELVVLQTRFTGSSFYELFKGYQPRGCKGYYNSDGILIEDKAVCKGRIHFKRVGDFEVVKCSVKIKEVCYDSVWLMFDCRRYI